MKTLNLFFDAEFTSLSPDAQLISLGIVSEEFCSPCIDKNLHPNEDCENCSGEWHKGMTKKSFYAEFTDFDINRCDQWVKDNVVSKLKYYPAEHYPMKEEITSNLIGCSHTETVKYWLKEWLSQFSDYNIQFVADCSTWDWWFMVQLLAEWDEKEIGQYDLGVPFLPTFRTGLPKLPANISPVPFDLNNLIAIKKGITPMEAFDLNREILSLGIHQNSIYANQLKSMLLEDETLTGFKGVDLIHNALYDATVIKEIYNKLK